MYHRSYENQNPIEVNVRLDKIEILSFPGPLPPLNKHLLKRDRIVPRDYRNRRIGDFLKELRLTEGRGTGIPKIRNSLKQNGSPSPIFETDDNLSYFLTILPVNKLFLEVKLDDYKTSILTYCVIPKSRIDILKYLGLTNHTGNYKRHVMPLVESGYLEYTLPHATKSPKQMYKTTTYGLSKLGRATV